MLVLVADLLGSEFWCGGGLDTPGAGGAAREGRDTRDTDPSRRRGLLKPSSQRDEKRQLYWIV